MGNFTSPDGTELAYRMLGTGPPLICLPGGPGRTPDYLGDLGGLAEQRKLILLDLRGTGGSADADPASYRCDRMVPDVEALRAHLGLEQLDLLAHSAGANLALLYAAAFPGRLAHLVLVTPSLRAVGESTPRGEQQAAMSRRSAEPWYPAALAAAGRADAGDTSLETRLGILPFYYGRWDAAAQAHSQVGFSERARPVIAAFAADGAFDPEATRQALRYLLAPVLVYAGGLDIGPTAELAGEAARFFPRPQVVVQPGAGHFPWVDDPVRFVSAVESFLS